LIVLIDQHHGTTQEKEVPPPIKPMAAPLENSTPALIVFFSSPLHCFLLHH